MSDPIIAKIARNTRHRLIEIHGHLQWYELSAELEKLQEYAELDIKKRKKILTISSEMFAAIQSLQKQGKAEKNRFCISFDGREVLVLTEVSITNTQRQELEGLLETIEQAANTTDAIKMLYREYLTLHASNEETPRYKREIALIKLARATRQCVAYQFSRLDNKLFLADLVATINLIR